MRTRIQSVEHATLFLHVRSQMAEQPRIREQKASERRNRPNHRGSFTTTSADIGLNLQPEVIVLKLSRISNRHRDF